MTYFEPFASPKHSSLLFSSKVLSSLLLSSVRSFCKLGVRAFEITLLE